MKVRNGFVSNSSSSSFILMLDRMPNDKMDLRKMLYGDDAPVFVTYYGTNSLSTELVSGIIFNDINNGQQLGVDGAVSLYLDEYAPFNQYSLPGAYDVMNGTAEEAEFRKLSILLTNEIESIEPHRNKYFQASRTAPDYKELQSAYFTESQESQERVNKLSKPMEDLFKKAMKNKLSKDKVYLEVGYGDGDGEYSAYIEHSGILSNILLERFSHH